ncbi:MAG: serine/threonine-protein kinase, partial [Pirellulaceae bacterium]
ERERFSRESKAIVSLSHPNIVKVYRSGVWNDQPFFAMELIAGGSLADRLQTGPLSASEIQRILLPVCDGVSHAHRSGVLHRDLKPENLLLTEDDLPKVTCFGLSKVLNDQRELTRVGQGLGTTYHVAPEQYLGIGASEASDVYSLGITLLEMMLGRSQFLEGMKGDTDPVNVLDQATKTSKWLKRGYPENLVAVCARCVQADPQNRYKDVDALSTELGEALASCKGGTDEVATNNQQSTIPSSLNENAITGRLRGLQLLRYAGNSAAVPNFRASDFG